MKAIVSGTASQGNAPANLLDVIIASRRGTEKDRPGLDEFAEIVTACKLPGEGGLPAQTAGNTGQVRLVARIREWSGFGKKQQRALSARQNARRTGSNK